MSKLALNNAISRTIASIYYNGPLRAFKQWWTIHDPKIGTKVGSDALGNEYYENLNEELGRERWVEYKQWSWGGQADKVTPEWHGWLHKMHDSPGTPEVPRPKYLTPYTPNYTGSPQAYKPYSTTRAKIESWTPATKPR
ncbi:NADH dehydrogenase 1 alpha subcomplex subunit 12 [Hyaloraphidium curvatum]|nr:NADH dehydrogenase 1 alpha subcomplex subunit 12 [Hyaloraphidium curvatum]